MPYPRDLRAYPASMLNTIEQVIADNRRVLVPCTSVQEANALRLRFYNLRKAILSTAGKDGAHPHADVAHKVRFSVDKSAPPNLIIEHIEDAPDTAELSARLSAALQKATP